MLEVSGLHAFYGSSHVLFGVDVRVAEGEVVAVLGRNGMGKTTLIRSIMGLLPPREGSVKMDGREMRGRPVDAVAKAGVGLVPEGRQLFTAMTVAENLELGAYSRRAAAKFAARRDEVFSLFPRLAERQHQRAGTLSGGEQQMVAIARGLMSDPDILIIDELSLGLAPVIVNQLIPVIRSLVDSGIGVLLIEQFAAVALSLAILVFATARQRD